MSRDFETVLFAAFAAGWNTALMADRVASDPDLYEVEQAFRVWRRRWGGGEPPQPSEAL